MTFLLKFFYFRMAQAFNLFQKKVLFALKEMFQSLKFQIISKSQIDKAYNF